MHLPGCHGGKDKGGIRVTRSFLVIIADGEASQEVRSRAFILEFPYSVTVS